MSNVIVLAWAGKHRPSETGAYCLTCGLRRDEDLDRSPCIPMVAQVPRGLLTSQQAAKRLSIGIDTFLTRYQTRRVLPSAVLIKKRTYLWNETKLTELALTNLAWQRSRYSQ